jgi:DNA-binding NarL/FixJ family response regulator
MARSILIVDDSRTIRQVLCERFNRENDFDVCGEAENGQETIERAKHLHPDLIVTDLSMPIMSGLEEARVLKQLMPTVPVIIYTAHSDRFIEKEAHAAGAYAVVAKSDPVTTLIEAARSASYQIAAA